VFVFDVEKAATDRKENRNTKRETFGTLGRIQSETSISENTGSLRSAGSRSNTRSKTMHNKSSRYGRAATIFWVTALALTAVVNAQAPAPRASGTVKTAAVGSLTVTVAGGSNVAVAVPDDAKVLQVAPGSTSLSSATPIALGDIVAGDKVLITGTAGDAAESLHATRVIVMKSAAIAQTHAAEEAAWQKGGGGLVKSVGSGNIVVSSGLRTMTVQTTQATKFRRYSGDSVRFEDATASQISDVHPGDQLRVRGARSADGSSIQADEIVTGSFHNFSGLLTAVDGTAGTVTLKDLASKRMVVVKVSKNSDLRRIPAQVAARFAARSAGTAAAGNIPAAAAPGGTSERASGGNARAGADLSQMLARLPTETLSDLKVGDAVMIVATQPLSGSAQPTAVTLLAGVEPILQASPEGDMVLTPWSVGGGAPDGGAQ
jgi:co-chaperonin GroES (HSP10)